MSDSNNYAPPKSRVELIGSGTDLSWRTATTVWWSMAWRGFLYGLAGGFFLGFVGGLIAAMHDPSQAVTYGAIGGYIAAIPASMLALKQALQKNLRSLALAAQQGAAGDVQDARA